MALDGVDESAAAKPRKRRYDSGRRWADRGRSVCEAGPTAAGSGMGQRTTDHVAVTVMVWVSPMMVMDFRARVRAT